jgi:hypothetical protein
VEEADGPLIVTVTDPNAVEPIRAITLGPLRVDLARCRATSGHAVTHDKMRLCLRLCKFVTSMMMCTQPWRAEPRRMGSPSLSYYVVKPLGWRLDHRSRNGYDGPAAALRESQPLKS